MRQRTLVHNGVGFAIYKVEEVGQVYLDFVVGNRLVGGVEVDYEQAKPRLRIGWCGEHDDAEYQLLYERGSQS